MPKVISYTPPWLSRPSPGAALFSSTAPKAPENISGKLRQESDYAGPNRILARRGNEAFTVVDNQIRWSSLTRLKNEWQQQTRSRKGTPDQKEDTEGKSDASDSVHYRVLTVPVYEQIRQLIPSPNGAFLAIVADHTVHIAVLPDPSHLSGTDSSPIRVKTYQLGPTTHVIPESPVVSALWHPLGVDSNLGGCIVTITIDAAVRVWELDRNNQWSFDRPTLAIDLRKLVDGTSSDEDFSPSGFGKNKGFSADYVDMEVASACFGGTGSEKEDAWAPMTLWVAMKPGDLYALCPLLPSKWRSPATTVPSLSAAIVPKLAALEEDPADFEDELTACRQQYEWLTEIDNQDPLHVYESHTAPDSEILTRPANPSAIPRLQGPFRIDTGDEVDDLDLCDLHVIAAKVDVDALMMGEEDELLLEENGEDRLSATVICLSTGSGRVHLCLELDGVEGQWLPRARKNAFRTPLSEPSDLVLVESLDTMREGQQSSKNWPTFTKDVHSRYDFFVTTENNVTFISLASWVQRLEAELQSEDTSGSGFRLEVLCEGTVSLRERIFQTDEAHKTAKDQPDHLPASVVYYDYDLGYLLLTYHGSHPYAAIMDTPEVSFPSLTEMNPDARVPGSPVLPPRRPPYQVPAIFYSDSPLEFFVDKHIPHRQRHTLKEQVRLSPATLDLVAAAHRILSAHTNALERAASDLFRRCERLQGEMQEQLKQLTDVSERIKGVSSEIGEDGERKENSRSGEALDKRLQAAKDKQDQLVQRYEAIRNKILKSGGRPLSEKEKSWVSEVETLSESFGDSKQEGRDNGQQLSERLETVKEIAADLLAEAKSVAAKAPPVPEPGSPASPGGAQPRVPQRLQRAKIADAMKMVERDIDWGVSNTLNVDRILRNMVAVRIYGFQKENLDIPAHLVTIIPTALRDAFYRARFIAGRAFRYLEYIEIRQANRYQAMCPRTSRNYYSHQMSVLRLFSWRHDYHWRNPTLAPTEKLDPAILCFHIDQSAYQSYQAVFAKYQDAFMSGPFRVWHDAKRAVEATAAKSNLSEVEQRMWNQFWRVNFLGEMQKWESRATALAIPSWEEIVDELYDAILECVEGAEDMLANPAHGIASKSSL